MLATCVIGAAIRPLGEAMFPVVEALAGRPACDPAEFGKETCETIQHWSIWASAIIIAGMFIGVPVFFIAFILGLVILILIKDR